MNQTIKLNPTENTLIGRIQINEGVVQVVCDATNGSFSVALPDCGGHNAEEITLRFIRKDEDRDNLVTLLPYRTQKINNETSQVLRVGAVMDITTDGENWW